MMMKSTIMNILHNASLRLMFCTVALSLSSVPVFAQDEADEASEEEATVKKPVRKVPQVNYPTVTVKGVVTDIATKKPVAGVQLQALGNIRYTAMTDEDGSFAIKVPEFTTALYVHSPGYQNQQVGIIAGADGQEVKVKLLKDVFNPMYGKGTEITAKAEAKIDHIAISVEDEVSSKLGADMRTVMRSGIIDAGAQMYIRGLSSITANSQPLVIVDGVEVDMQYDRYSLHEGQFNNVLATISPDDIEKVTVLKNATALYGARGANGVVLIDTKRGKSMATRIDANISVGVITVPKLPTMMNGEQYRVYASELLGTMEGVPERHIKFHFLDDNPNGYYYNWYHNDTDWSKEVYKSGFTQNYSVNVQGGDDIGMYNLSVGYMDGKYAAKGNEIERMNLRFNTDINITQSLKTKFDISISRVNNDVLDNAIQSDFSKGTVTSPNVLGLIKSPLVTPYQYSETLNGGLGGFTDLESDYDDIFRQVETFDGEYGLANPLTIISKGEGNNKNRAETTYFTVRLEPTYQISHDFKLSAMLNYSLNRHSERYFRPYGNVPSFNLEGVGRVYAMTRSLFSKDNNFVAKLQLDWNHQFGRHTLAAFAGARFSTFSYDNSDASVQSTAPETSDKDPNLSWSGYRLIGGSSDTWRQMQWFGNFDYNYMNRYFATVTLLGESNSRFGKEADGGIKMFGVKWAIFPSVQLGWVLTNEKWFPKKSFVNYLKVNAGYDMSGNDGISNYAARTSYSVVRFNNNAIGTQLTNVGNDLIKWETTNKFNFGVAANLFDNRVGFRFDYFIHNTKDLLTQRAFSNPIGGINLYWSNGGKLKNTGYEIAISGKPVVGKDWNVEVGATIGHYKNEIKELPDNFVKTQSIYGDNNILTEVGNPVGVFYGYQTAGVFASDEEARLAGNGTYLYMEDDALAHHDFKAGDVHFVDQNGDGKIDAQDKVVIGDPNPSVYGNIFANVFWKRFSLAIGFNYSLGNDIYNYQRSILTSGSNFFNQQVSEVGRWRHENQAATLPRAVFGDPMGNNRFSDRWIEDGSYLRLKTLKLAYAIPIPNSWTNWLQGLSVWAEAQNLFTITKYLGSDPELSNGYGVLYQGIDTGNLAHSRSFTFGVKINL